MKNALNNYIELPFEALVKAHWNYKEDSQSKSSKLQKNLEKNGQVQNLIVRELEHGKYEVVNGNHRMDDMQAVGMKTAVCFNLGKITLANAKRIAIETNETNFDTDPIRLSEILNDLTSVFSAEDMLETMPYSDDDFVAIMNLNNGFEEEESEKKSVNFEAADSNFASIEIKVRKEQVEFIKGQLKNFFLGRFDFEIVE